jgi:hypothetical protein
MFFLIVDLKSDFLLLISVYSEKIQEMRFFFFVLIILITIIQPITADNYCIFNPAFSYQKPDLPQTQKGEYIIHKDKIESEILILKEKYPELAYDIISYKFLYAPKSGRKQFFEADGGLLDLLKRYSRNSSPGDIINITEVAYRESTDTASHWKKFSPKLHFIYQ